MVQNIRLTIEYDGSRYHGWQSARKDGASTISGRICDVLRRMTNEEITLFCGEKTEANVHAFQQTASFHTTCRMSPEEIRQYLNQYLPLDIVIHKADQVPERFHAELNPHTITYRYRILTGTVSDVFQRKYADFQTDFPDIRAMKNAADSLIGTHDFRSFSAGKTKKSTTRKLCTLEILSMQSENLLQHFNPFFCPSPFYPENEEIEILLVANGFLKQMPQRIVGTLLEIGYGMRTPDCIEHIFEGTENSSPHCINNALFLEQIDYI